MDLRNFPFDVQKCNLTIESCKFMRQYPGGIAFNRYTYIDAALIDIP